ncbi:DNA ligase D [Jannaschia helgolandensis]|uniref:DNA ligase (ATP) n=1 Tax=Jannaschia helgolandensis TaxID=188906 RepID=A0A1H7P935_9RHOB|nr:DNA ligase D [Jannaschia helgolandensis]SEL32282.1 ATP-dependent DNA ligase LigD phosphoesterase module /ATP-dependent DNA ligase LigD polymerase module [Jannaschia helgolandensis]
MAGPGDKLADYSTRRDFSRTAEPEGKMHQVRRAGLQFLVQKHAATRLHYDFRLEWNGVLLSWAVTKGPTADPRQKRLAVRTEDHPLDYGDFEGTIPKGEYGGGTVMLWDEGTWLPKGDPDAGLTVGNLKVVLQGHRMRGAWALVRMKPRKGEKRENWLLIKERDALASDEPDGLTATQKVSVRTGRTMNEIARGEKFKPAATKKRDGKRPPFRKVQLATLAETAPEGDDWIHETKFDGYRCLASLGKGGTRLFTRSGNDWTNKFAALDGAFDTLPCASALIDGEVMAARISGTAFSSLQDALNIGDPLVFYAFDLLSLDGADLAKLPQTARREALTKLMAGMPEGGTLRMSQHVQGHGPEVFAAACEAGAEGIISKRCDAPYRGARTKAWRKQKCTKRQEFVVGGLSPSEKRGRPFASLLLGEFGPDGLRYRGRVGTGFTDADFDRLEKTLKARKTSPFIDVPANIARAATWVTPKAVVEIDFAEFTADGHIRHGTYLGLREDKEAATVTIEQPETDSPVVAGVKISNPDRRVFGDAGFTKLDVARYYERAGERLTEIAGHRPLSLLRCPGGLEEACFFQKHGHGAMPAALQRIAIEESNGETADYLYATRAESFVAAAQMGTVEFHIQGARTDRLDRPDRLVFDLDPDEGLGWDDVRQTALDLRGWLSDLALESGAMVTGGKGVHVWVPLRRTQGWDAVRGFAKTLAHVLEEKEPKRFTASMSKARRKGRIFIDWLRNERGATAVAPWSLRARAGAPVAVPVGWDELANLKGAATFTLTNIDTRLAAPCPYLKQANSLHTLDADTATRLQDWIDS